MRAIILEESGAFKEICHLCHFIELLVVAFVELEENGWSTESVEAIIIPHWSAPTWRGRVHDHNLVLIRRFFPNAVVSTPVEGPRFSPTEAIHVDRGRPHHIKCVQRLNPYRWFAALQGRLHHNSLPVVTYVSRQNCPVRQLHRRIHARLVSELNAINDIVFQEVYMEDLDFERQLAIARNTDVLLGVHGNGLSHAMFMRPKKFVCEIFVPGTTFQWHYYTFSKAMGHEYISIFDGDAMAPSTFNIGRTTCQTHSLNMLAVHGFIQQAKDEILSSQ